MGISDGTNERILMDRGFVLMGVNEFCPNGLDITTESRCNEAQIAAESMGLNPSRDVLLVGDWPGVPYRCSAQVGTDNPEFKDDVHWCTNEATDNSRFITGEFRMICEIGHCCYNCMGFCVGPFHDDDSFCTGDVHGCDPKHCAPWCGTSNDVKCIGSQIPPDGNCCDVTKECNDNFCPYQCCTYFMEQCQQLCDAQSGGIRHSQCWGDPRYCYCQCTDSTVFHIPGFECVHPDCPPDA